MKNRVAAYFFEQKNIRGYILAYMAAAVVAGCLSVISATPGFVYWLMKVLQVACFAGLGIMHSLITEKGLPFVSDRFQSRLRFTALLAGLVFTVLLVLYLLAGGGGLMMALASACAFFLPYTWMQLWSVSSEVTVAPRPLTWFGYTDELDSPDIVYLSSIPVTFKMTRGYYIQTPEFLSIKAPLDMELSKVFNLCVAAAKKNYNIPLESADEDGRPFGWEFFTERMKGLLSVQLDPATCVGDNEHIKTNSVIVAKRVKSTRPFHMPLKKEMA